MDEEKRFTENQIDLIITELGSARHEVAMSLKSIDQQIKDTRLWYRQIPHWKARVKQDGRMETLIQHVTYNKAAFTINSWMDETYGDGNWDITEHAKLTLYGKPHCMGGDEVWGNLTLIDAENENA